MNFFLRFVIFMVMPITGCAANHILPSTTVQPTGNVQSSVKTQHSIKEPLAHLHGLEVKGNKLRLQVMSNGCTKVKSFELIWQGNNLTIQRLKPDYCRRMPHKIWLEFKMPTQIKAFNIANEFVD